MKILTGSEEITEKLCRLYRSFGYGRFRMNKFEEYSFYMEHKNFLGSENIISFGDLDGRLLALKPDITLSIAKNAQSGENRRVYYSESVYRPSYTVREYKEIKQIGLERIGDVDMLAECETVLLAVKSMEALGGRFTLDLSDLRFVSSLLDGEGFSDTDRAAILDGVRKKDGGKIMSVCKTAGKDEATAKRIASVAEIHGAFDKAAAEAEKICSSQTARAALDELKEVYGFLSAMGAADNVNLDFSIINDMSYYNGIVFQGYLEGVPKNVLSGGRYDNLLQKMGKSGGACGFAVYPDLIDLYKSGDIESDADVAVIYGDGDDISAVGKFAESLRNGDNIVVSAKRGENIKAKKTIVFGEAGK